MFQQMDIKRESLVRKLYRYKSSLPPAEIVKEPPVYVQKAIEKMTRGVNEIEELEKLYLLQLKRISIDAETESKINKLLYDGEEPTWFAPYLGGSTINTNNSVNDNAVHDIVFPQILYNNTPITDYMDRTEQDVFGVFDGSGNQIQSPMDFPNSFITRPTYWFIS